MNMKPHYTPLRIRTTAIALLTLACTGWPLATIAQEPKGALKPGDPVVLNFVNADIESVARTVATLSGANVVVDPRVKGTMNLSSTVAVPLPSSDSALADRAETLP